MFRKSITIFRLFGFEVKIDASWLILAALIIWTLAREFFPGAYPQLSTFIHWLMALAGTGGFVISIVFHELCHSLVARRFGLPMKGITLFVFGGVAELTREPENARAELFMAAVGPLSSLFLASVFLMLGKIIRLTGQSPAFTGVFAYLSLLNFALALFNLLPAFPLDGGRILRSFLWTWKKDLVVATKIASGAGVGFAFLLIISGLISLLTDRQVTGIWWILIGLFLKSAAENSYRQVIIQKLLEGQKVKYFMKPDPVTVAPDVSVRDFIKHYVYVYHYHTFPVVQDNQLLGCLPVHALKGLGEEDWDKKTVRDFMEPCSPTNTIGPDEDAGQVLTRMHRIGKSKFLVVENERLVGILTLKDMLAFISLKIELEGIGHRRIL
ncbi:MAG: site-2 protease family protein [Candidatus Omnitrophica bacterium]|nr:site-2 protease family protein [Candidatus Omnitrophota bacterium]